MDGDEQNTISFAEFEVDTAHRQLRRNGDACPLYARTYDLLSFLLKNNGVILSKDEILEAVWEGQIVEEANLSVQISAFRKALGEDKSSPRFLITVPGKGYKFVADIANGDDGMVIERHKISHITIEREAENGLNGSAVGHSDPSPSRTLTQPQAAEPKSRFSFAAIVLAVLVFSAFALGGYFLFRTPKAPVPFQKVSVKRLTTTGKVVAAAISPDGKYVAFAQGEPEGNSLWVQQAGTASLIRILPPVKGAFWDLRFSPDGAFVYYNIFSGETSDPELFRLPSLGGVVEKIPHITTFAITFSPDGRQIAYIQPDSASATNYLFIADADGGNRRLLTSKPQPNTYIFDGRVISWSPDGATVACLVNHLDAEASYYSIVGIDIRNGTERPLSSQRWHDVEGLEWIRDGSGLLVTDTDKSSTRNQIWFVSAADGDARAVTNDANSYGWARVTADGRSFVALQTGTTSGIFVGDTGSSNFNEIVTEADELGPIAWRSDGSIVFRSAADGRQNLSTVDADGSDRRQLTANGQVSERGFLTSPDGKYIVFVSWRSGKSNLWRVDADGGNPVQLTFGEADAYPRITPDGTTVIYQTGIFSKPELWKVPIGGGEPVRLTDYYAKWVAVSGSGSQISFLHMVDSKWRIGFITPDGKTIRPDIDAPSNLKENKIYWTTDERELIYVAAQGNVGNLWTAAIDGSAIKPLTVFASHWMSDFAVSPDGKRLATVRGLSISDVVLIESEETP